MQDGGEMRTPCIWEGSVSHAHKSANLTNKAEFAPEEIRYIIVNVIYLYNNNAKPKLYPEDKILMNISPTTCLKMKRKRKHIIYHTLKQGTRKKTNDK